MTRRSRSSASRGVACPRRIATVGERRAQVPLRAGRAPGGAGRRARPLGVRWLRLPRCVRASRRRQLRESATAMEPDFARGVVVSVLVGYAVSVVALVPAAGSRAGWHRCCGPPAPAARSRCNWAISVAPGGRSPSSISPAARAGDIDLPADSGVRCSAVDLPGFASASALLVLEPPLAGWPWEFWLPRLPGRRLSFTRVRS